ncbi:hypothetical protein CBL_21320, partial [Carabus blaptoides fortunei]
QKLNLSDETISIFAKVRAETSKPESLNVVPKPKNQNMKFDKKNVKYNFCQKKSHSNAECRKLSTRAEQANIASSSLALLWHDRPGHVGFDTLKKMSDDGSIPYPKLTNSDNFFSEPCLL